MTPTANQDRGIGDTPDLPPDAELHELLKRCPASTYEAARRFRRTGDPTQIPIIVAGVIEHHVEPDLRAKLRSPDDQLRLVEDLGLDSLTLMEVVMLMEDALGILIGNEELTGLRTLGDVNRLAAGRLCGLPPPMPAPFLTGGWAWEPNQSQPS